MDYKKLWRERTRAWAIEILGDSCSVCSSEDSLEFDHRDSSTKVFDISVGIRDGYSKMRLLEELSKCQLLCGEHHLEKTIRESSVSHGGGNSGKKNCKCDKCKKKKAEYMKQYHATHARKRDR